MSETDQSPNLDRMLSSFFKAELPDPFPAMKIPAELPMVANTTRWTEERAGTSKSRFALAVSVALLLGGCWYLSGQIGNVSEQSKIGNGIDNAKIPKEILKAKDESKKPMMP